MSYLGSYIPLILVFLCLLEDLRVGPLCEQEDLLRTGRVLNRNAHSLAGIEGEYVHQFIGLLLVQNLQLDVGLGPLNELIANVLGVVHKADLVRAGPFVLPLSVVPDHLVAEDHALEELVETGLPAEGLHIILNLFGLVDPAPDGYLLEDHLVGGKGPCLVGEHIGDHPQFLQDRAVQDATAAVGVLVFELVVDREEDPREGLDALDEDDQRYGDEEVQQDEDTQEVEPG